MKKLLIFCISLNLSLATGLGLVFYLGRREKNKIETEKNTREESLLSECIDMLERAGISFAQKDFLSARVALKMVSYNLYDSKNAEKAKLVGMGDWYFFESELWLEEEQEQEFYSFVGAARSAISGKEFNLEESEIVEKIRIAHDSFVFSHATYPSLNSKAEIGEKLAAQKARHVLGEQVVIEKCDESLFPLSYNYSGKNTFVSISKLGGKIIKLYFYPGNSEYDTSEEKTLEIMRNFMRKEGLPELHLDSVDKNNGMYYAVFSHPEDKEASLIIGVKGNGGRVCLFDAENFYKYY